MQVSLSDKSNQKQGSKMAKRPPIPRNVERKLWAESMGYCMKPGCGRELITPEESVNISEMAHIIDHALGGDVSFDNLVLLCEPCHKITDETRNEKTIPTLREWKRNRNAEIRAKFTQVFTNFDALKKSIAPILTRNDFIFNSYGPETSNYSLWKKFEPELISNNNKILLLLKQNRKFLHKTNQDIVDKFEAHVLEFEATRDEIINRENLFPIELMSIFGLKEISHLLQPTIGPIHNLIKKLKEKYKIFLTKAPITINYINGNDINRISISDGPNVLQKLYANWCYKQPLNTNLRTENLIFFTDWLDGRGIPWEFVNDEDLTRILVKDLIEVQLVYEYQVSVDTINKIILKDGLIIINMHNWNGAPFSADAISIIENSGSRAMKSNEFFSLCYREILK